jgi:GNAT superfamily N-acetyltransferase
MEFRVVPIRPALDLTINSGESDLDLWLAENALGAEARNVGRTFVLIRNSAPEDALGYYTLAAHQIDRDVLPRSIGHGSPDRIPAFLLAKLAIDNSLQGRGLGRLLLGDALLRVSKISQQVGARFLVVHALSDDAVQFYQRQGFRLIGEDRTLVLKISTIQATLNTL